MLAGSLGLPGSFVTTGKSASLNFGPFSVSAPINGKHASASISFKAPKKLRTGEAPPLRSWTVKIALKKQTLFAALSTLGFMKMDVSGANVSVPVSLVVDGLSYDATIGDSIWR